MVLTVFVKELPIERAKMVLYKHPTHLGTSQDAAFDALHSPGIDAPHAGIYRCVAWGHEIGIAMGHKLPPQGHHQHPAGSGPIRWQMLVYAQHSK
jgi:hypothetical protein